MDIILRCFDPVTKKISPSMVLSEELMILLAPGASVGYIDASIYGRLIWMLRTSKQDKNGDYIFCGDILKYTRHNFREKRDIIGKDISDVAVVRFCEKTMSMKLDMYNNERCFATSGFFFYDTRADKVTIEIIGNIYENPDLLPS